MSNFTKGPKDFWTGVMFLGFGGVAVYIARDYGVGTAASMGPGYFPTAIGVLLMLLGGFSVVRSFLIRGAPTGPFSWRPPLVVIGGTVSFAFLLERVGLPIALLVLILVAASGSSKFRFSWGASFAMIGLIVACTLVFAKGLGVPLPLVGSWFGDL